MTDLLQVEEIRKKRAGRVVLDNASLRIGPGEIVGLLGPNGAGKSTLFGILTGLIKPDSGRIRYANNEINTSSFEHRSRIGMVFQSPSLDAQLTVKENLDLTADCYAIERGERVQRITRLLNEAGLSDRANDKVLTLSGGMKRKLDLARALMHEPEILLLDEPSSGLDIAAQRSFWSWLTQWINATKRMALVATHNIDEARRCDRLVLLHQGKVVAEDTPSALCERVEQDTIEMKFENDQQALAACEHLEKQLSVSAKVSENTVEIKISDAQTAIVKVVSTVPDGLQTVSLRKADLGDVFMKYTGRKLDAGDMS